MAFRVFVVCCAGRLFGSWPHSGSVLNWLFDIVDHEYAYRSLSGLELCPAARILLLLLRVELRSVGTGMIDVIDH